MDDLLQRLLAVDRQGDSTVKAAEEKAVHIREAAAAKIAAMNAEFSKALTAECAAIEKSAEENAEARRTADLVVAKQDVAARRVKFAAAVAPFTGKLLDELLGL